MVGVAPADASAGSVPSEVIRYVTTGPMVARLNDVYGPNAAGTKGIDFDATTKPGPISRVWLWTDERRAGKPTAHPTRMTNRWVVPVTVAGHPIGIATIWINPDLDAPELAEFETDVPAAVALATVPASAQLIHDTVSRAWLALDAGVLTPLVRGLHRAVHARAGRPVRHRAGCRLRHPTSSATRPDGRSAGRPSCCWSW